MSSASDTTSRPTRPGTGALQTSRAALGARGRGSGTQASTAAGHLASLNALGATVHTTPVELVTQPGQTAAGNMQAATQGMFAGLGAQRGGGGRKTKRGGAEPRGGGGSIVGGKYKMGGKTAKGGRRGRSLRSRRGRGRSTRRMSTPWAGWGAEAPQGHARTVMKRDCPKGKCFLGPGKSFPVCRKGTCQISSKGLWAAYIRAKQWGGPTRKYKGKARPTHARKVYTRVARSAKRQLEKRGFRVGK